MTPEEWIEQTLAPYEGRSTVTTKEIAECLGWVTKDGKPDIKLVQRMCQRGTLHHSDRGGKLSIPYFVLVELVKSHVSDEAA